MIRRAALASVLGLWAWLGAPGGGSLAATEPTQVRTFEVRFRGLTDAAEVVGPVLSSAGTMKLQPRLKTLVVEDRPDVLVRVESVLRAFDVPPRNVEVTLTLLLGSDTREGRAAQGIGPEAISREIRGIHETLGDFTKWTNYELVGSQAVTVVEGQGAAVQLSEEYRVSLEVSSVEPPSATAPQGTVHLRVVLRRLSRGAAGEDAGEDLYSTRIQLQAGKLLTVGAARSPESRKALFLTLRARAG